MEYRQIELRCKQVTMWTIESVSLPAQITFPSHYKNQKTEFNKGNALFSLKTEHPGELIFSANTSRRKIKETHLQIS